MTFDFTREEYAVVLAAVVSALIDCLANRETTDPRLLKSLYSAADKLVAAMEKGGTH